MKTPELPAFGPTDLQYTENVSRETLARLKAYIDLLSDWNARHNLVSAHSLAHVWQRHVLDSAQLLPFIPEDARTLLDLGSGAGFPGLVLAIMLENRRLPPPPLRGTSPMLRTGEEDSLSSSVERSEMGEVARSAGGGRPVQVVLYEATRKKCEFLEAAAARTGAKVEIRNVRIEEAKAEPFDVVTARALAPLDKLLAYAHVFQGKRTLNLFLKGQSVVEELALAHKSWRMTVTQHPSRSDPSGAILAIRELRHVA